MDFFSFPPVHAALELAYSAVTALGTALAPFAGASSVAAAIAVTTLAVRLALLPLGITAAKAQAAARRLAPRAEELRRRHRRSPERLQRELAALYKKEGVSPLAGMLPLFAQLPVVGIVYALFTRTQIGDHTNGLFEHTLAGVPLGPSLAHTTVAGDITLALGIVAAVVVALTVLSAELSRRTARRLAVPPSASAPVAIPKGMTTALSYLPYATLVAAVAVPFAAGIYVVVSAIWGAVERAVLARRFSPTLS